MTDGDITLSVEETLTALKEATKIQIAVNYARLVVMTEDEDGNELPEEEVQAQLNSIFAEQADEFEATLMQAAQRIFAAKQAQRSPGLYIARESDGPSA